MIHNLINYFISVIYLLLASIEDFRVREVPDIFSYSLIVSGVGISIIFSLIEKTWANIIGSILGLIVAIIIGSALYFTGQWGGGDFKVLMGLGTLLGVSINSFNLSSQPFLLFMINLAIASIIFGIIYMIYLIIRDWNNFLKEFNAPRRTTKAKLLRGIIILMFLLLVAFFFMVDMLLELKFFVLFILSSAYIIYYLISVSKALEKSSMRKEIPVSKLTEGDWITHNIIIKGKKIYEPSKTGITIEDIEKLKKSGVKTVIVKEGMPLIPAFFIAILMNILIGNWLTHFHIIF